MAFFSSVVNWNKIVISLFLNAFRVEYYCKFSFLEVACTHTYAHTHARTHARTFNGPFTGTTQVGRYQKGKTNLDFTEERDSEWQWHQLIYMQICTLLQTDNHASTSPLSFLQAGCPSCHPTNSIKALKALKLHTVL